MINKDLLAKVLEYHDVIKTEIVGQGTAVKINYLKSINGMLYSSYTRINIYELAFRVREYMSEEHNIFLTLDCSIDDFYRDANMAYHDEVLGVGA